MNNETNAINININSNLFDSKNETQEKVIQKPQVEEENKNTKAEIKVEEQIIKKEPKENEKYLDKQIDLKKKKELLESKLKEQKIKQRYEEVEFPSIKNRIKQVDLHFLVNNSKPQLNNNNNESFEKQSNNVENKEPQYQTAKSGKSVKSVKSEAEEIGDKIISDKPVLNKKKMKSKPIIF